MDLQVSARNILVNVQDIIFVQEDNDTQVIHKGCKFRQRRNKGRGKYH